MASIKFNAIFGDEIKVVNLSQPLGMSSENWHINVGGYHHGVILTINNEYLYVNDFLDSDDVQAIVDRIIEFKNEPWQRAKIHVNSWPEFPVKQTIAKRIAV